MFVPLFFAAVISTLPASGARSRARPPHAHRTRSRLGAGFSLERADALVSARARRRMAIYLELRLLELRKEHLERAADVVRGRLPLESLLQDPG